MLVTRPRKGREPVQLTHLAGITYAVFGQVAVSAVVLHDVAGTVDHCGSDPWAMVVLVVCTPFVGWSSWWAFARVTSGPFVHGGLCPCYQWIMRSFPTLHSACLWSRWLRRVSSVPDPKTSVGLSCS